ncbi:MAG TPA: hypothetical protein VJT75_02520 [Thermoleophilaceae bacterium]|nr:hypothetical protein [Thermoleophilaceae bacterium]
MLFAIATLGAGIVAGLSSAADQTATDGTSSVLDDSLILAAAQRSIEEQGQRDAARQTSAARADRAESRESYRDLSASEALDTDRRELPQVVTDPAFRPFRPDPGADVERYRDGDTAAVIETAEGEHVVAESDLPLRGITAAGDRSLVDLSLEDHGERFIARSTAVRASLPDELGAGAKLPYSVFWSV